jgi:hypothetical protein
MTNVCGSVAPPDAGVDACAPKTCVDLGAECGPNADGCGNMIQCGTCPQCFMCLGTPGLCVGGGCCPTTCQQQGFNCAIHGDGCGNIIDCGTCTAPETCGGSGSPGVCGTPPDGGVDACAPQTCAQQGFDCGFPSDACGNIIDCGTCPAGKACGGGGQPYKCGP